VDLDVRQRPTEHGTGGNYALKETCSCCIAPRLAPTKSGGITI
jgi:hypothetical protein